MGHPVKINKTHLRHAHLVRGQGASLVGADDVRATKGLNARKVTNDRVLLSHLLRAKGETCGDHSSQTLRDSGDGERNSNLEVVHSSLKNTVVRGVPEVTDIHKPDQNADNSDDLGEHVTKVVEFPLQWSLLANLRADRLVDVANSSLLSGENDNRSALAIDDRSALKYNRPT